MGRVPDGRRGDGAGSPGVTGNRGAADRVTAAAAELYGADPREFTDRRKALAAAARDAGEADAARRIAALRKPTRAAWVVNRLARADPGAATRLTGLAAGLRTAEQARDGPRLRELSAERGPLIDALTGQALAAAGVADPPAGLREEVAATLTAALADREVAAAFAAGTLTRAAQWAGFGLALTEGGPGTGDTGAEGHPAEEAPEAWRQPPAPTRPKEEGRRRRAEEDRRRAEEGRRRRAEEDRRRAEEGRRRPAEEDRRLAAEAAQAAARRRKIFENAEREVTSASAAAMDTAAAEDRLEREVRDLEERLTRARAQLADARLRARRAEAAERKARQALGRLAIPAVPRPPGALGS